MLFIVVLPEIKFINASNQPPFSQSNLVSDDLELSALISIEDVNYIELY